MIERGDYEFMNRFDTNNPGDREKILAHPTEKYEVGNCFSYVFKSHTLEILVKVCENVA